MADDDYNLNPGSQSGDDSVISGSNDSLEDSYSASSKDEEDEYSSEAKDPMLLMHYSQSVNIAEHLSEEELTDCANKVMSGMEDDETTMTKWRVDMEEGTKLSRLEKEPKNVPFTNAANIKFPLITNACYQFSARVYPEFIQDGKVVKCQVVGSNPPQELMDKATRVYTHMSWQLLGEDTEWEVSLDKLLVTLPNIGFLLKKTYYDPLKKKNRSFLCATKDITLRNECDISCLDDLRRITHTLFLSRNDLIEGKNEKIYLKDTINDILDTQTGETLDKPIEIIEQHRFLDLDSDGYEEPYIVTVHKETNKVIRILARYTPSDIELDGQKVKRITPIQSFTDYHFLPSLDGTFMSVGFGVLMLHLNETVNSLMNMLLDSGKVANMQTLIMDSRIKIPGGSQFVEPGTIIKLQAIPGEDLQKGIVPLVYKEPSPTLFQLFGVLVQAAKELSSSTESLQGTAESQNTPATTNLSQVEQGMKVFKAILLRVWRSQKAEFQKLFELNRRFMDPREEVSVVGQTITVSQDDYKDPSIRVIPIANPSLSSDAQRMAKLNALVQIANTPLGQATLNPQMIMQNILETMDLPNPESFLMPQQQKKPDPKMLTVQAKMQKDAHETALKNRKQDLDEAKFMAGLSKDEELINEIRAKALKLIADAAHVADKTKLEHMSLQLDAINSTAQIANNLHKNANDSTQNVRQALLQKQQQDQLHQRETQSLGIQQQQADQDGQAQQSSDQSVDQTPSDGQTDTGSGQ